VSLGGKKMTSTKSKDLEKLATFPFRRPIPKAHPSEF
jgi:hypothetical protein